VTGVRVLVWITQRGEFVAVLAFCLSDFSAEAVLRERQKEKDGRRRKKKRSNREIAVGDRAISAHEDEPTFFSRRGGREKGRESILDAGKEGTAGESATLDALRSHQIHLRSTLF